MKETLLFLAVLGMCSFCRSQEQTQANFWKDNRVVLPVCLATHTWDAIVTNRAFQHPGWQESNPLVPHSTGAQAGYFIGTAALGTGSAWLLYGSGHPKAAKILLRTWAVVEIQAATRTSINLARRP